MCACQVNKGEQPQPTTVSLLPETITVKMTDLQFLLDRAEKSSLVGLKPDEEWTIRNLANQMNHLATSRPTQAPPPEAVTVRTSDLQALFSSVINTHEFSPPPTGAWNFRPDYLQGGQQPELPPPGQPGVDVGSIRALKAHVSDIIEEQEEKIVEKGFMTPKEKELMNELKQKEETLEEIVNDLERRPKLVTEDISGRLPPDSSFNPDDFSTPAGGAWNYRQAFIDFMKKRIQAAKATSTTPTSDNLPPFAQPLARVTDELVAALQSSDFEPPEGGSWDFKSAAQLIKKLKIQPHELPRSGLGVTFPSPRPLAAPVTEETPSSTLTEELGEANIRGLVMLHMEESEKEKVAGEILNNFPEYNEDDYYDDDYYEEVDNSLDDFETSYLGEEEVEENRIPGKVTSSFVKSANGTVFNTNVINKAGFPQVWTLIIHIFLGFVKITKFTKYA